MCHVATLQSKSSLFCLTVDFLKKNVKRKTISIKLSTPAIIFDCFVLLKLQLLELGKIYVITGCNDSYWTPSDKYWLIVAMQMNVPLLSYIKRHTCIIFPIFI